MASLEDVTSQLSNATSTQNERISSTEENIVSLDERISGTEEDVLSLDQRVEDLESNGGGGSGNNVSGFNFIYQD